MAISKKTIEAKQSAFIAAYGECGSIRAACKASNVSRSAVSSWREKNINNFKDKFITANEMFKEYLQDMAVERIKNQKPTDNPVLLITLLNAHYPEKDRRDAHAADSGMKDIMGEWKKWVKDNNKPSKKSPDVTEAESARQNAIDEVEKILSRRKPNDNSNPGDN